MITNYEQKAADNFKKEIIYLVKKIAFSSNFASNVIKIFLDEVMEGYNYIKEDNLYPDLLCPILDRCLPSSVTVSNLKSLLTGLSRECIELVATHTYVQQQNITLDTLLLALGLESEAALSASTISSKRLALDVEDSPMEDQDEYKAKRPPIDPDIPYDCGKEESSIIGDDN